MAVADRRYSHLYYDRGGEVYVEGSRGCAYCACSICECRDFLGSRIPSYKWRAKPIQTIIEDIRLLIKEGISEFTFSDEDFIGSDDIGIKHAEAFANTLLKEKLHIHYRINARVHSIFNQTDNPYVRARKIRLLKILQRSGMIKIFLGFESGSSEQLKRYNKGFSLSEFLSAKSILDQLSIDYELGYICLDPLMTLAELNDSLQFIQRYNCIPHISSIYKELRIQCGNFSYLKQVRVYEKQHHMLLLGEMDHTEQMYPILQYANPSINTIKEYMTAYEQQSYQLYYYMRILTQYVEKDTAESHWVYRTMQDLKYLDYDLLTALVNQLSNRDGTRNKLTGIFNDHVIQRMNCYRRLAHKLSTSNEKKFKYFEQLYREIIYDSPIRG